MNPKKVKAIIEMRSLTWNKEVQRFTGRVATLARFLLKPGDKSHHFFKAIKAWKNKFRWTEECEKAFYNLKEFLQSPPVMAKPEPGETLFGYLSISEVAGATVLTKEDDGVMKPAYYVSHIF